MTANRIRRRLAALRKCLSRPAYNRAALPGLYDRALLFGGGAVLTLSILAAAAVGIAHRFERCIDDWRAGFLVQRDFVNASVERNQARMRHTVETYEALSHVHAREAVPVDRYRRLLQENDGFVVTDEDIGAPPLTILSTLTALQDRERLAALLTLVREISPRSLLRQRGAADDIGGFLYTGDRRFLAVWPPIAGGRLATDERGTHAGGGNAATQVEALIGRFVTNVEAELHKHPDTLLRRDRVFWVTLYNSDMYGTLVKHYAAPIYSGDTRIAVLAVTLPATQIPRLFQPAVHDPDFFMVSRDRRHLIGIDGASPRGERWMHALKASPSVFELADERLRFVRRGGDFFLIQRIAGPGWIAVSAFDWRMIAANLKGPIGWTVGLTCLVLAVQWVFVILIDRLVLAPLRARARRVFESEVFSRTVLATAPVGLTVFDPSTQRIVMQNGIARALLSASGDEPSFYRRLLDSRRRRRGERSRARRGARASPAGVIRSAEVTVTATDGRRRELSVAFARARYREQEVILCSLTDISRQKETVRLLRRARQAADEASRAKSMLVATISHEIRTPLYGALGNLELLSMEALTPSQAARVGSVRRAFDALLSLVDDVLDLSKAEAHELRLSVEPFRLDEVIERCTQTLAPAITGKGLRLLCLVDPSVAGSWYGDGLRIGQIVTNLLGNACKFTRNGSIRIYVTAARAADREGDGGAESVILRVADSGIGIAEKRQSRIFEPFMQADASIGRRFGGTGLGLSLSWRLVDLMGGRIELSSAQGRGAVFTVRLPLRRDRETLATPCAYAGELAFDMIVVACEDRAWQAVLAAQLRYRFGTSITVEEAQPGAWSPHAGARSIVVLGSHADEIPPLWLTARLAYVDAVVVSERGPLHPQRRYGALHVTSLSAAKLELAVAACGRSGDVPVPDVDARGPSFARAEHRAARILVVDDDAVSRALLANQLEVLGYRQVDPAADGQEALAACLRHAYDLVVADLCMPVMGGRELLVALRGKGVTTPVIAHTAAPCSAGDARQIGFIDLLYKPLSLDRLRQALEVVFDASPPSATASVTIGIAQFDPLSGTANATPRCDAARSVPLANTLRAVFSACWPEDEARLRTAASSGDAESFLQALHRLHGALLALGERDASAKCSALRDRVLTEGMLTITEPFGELTRDVARIARVEAAMMPDGEARRT
ncbi:MAG TPA: ATP-binding protein [Trinickia sp.]|uniref:ATP-binding protein n=1 Tax=Trinickia sp. TaxID=2571163 RepID=UPI002BC0FF3F|nr:ATP-binding protein [Trinickia sp.]HTI18222.1 ATP-binding protein [Trinickia sp.]